MAEEVSALVLQQDPWFAGSIPICQRFPTALPTPISLQRIQWQEMREYDIYCKNIAGVQSTICCLYVSFQQKIEMMMTVVVRVLLLSSCSLEIRVDFAHKQYIPAAFGSSILPHHHQQCPALHSVL